MLVRVCNPLVLLISKEVAEASRRLITVRSVPLDPERPMDESKFVMVLLMSTDVIVID